MCRILHAVGELSRTTKFVDNEGRDRWSLNRGELSPGPISKEVGFKIEIYSRDRSNRLEAT